MKIENIHTYVNTPKNQINFGNVYINIKSLNNYSKTNNSKCIIQALKDKNTPLRKFFSEVLNTKQFENDMGDCYISFEHKNDFLYSSDTINFSFPKKHQLAVRHIYNLFKKEEFQKVRVYEETISNHIAEQTSFKSGFIGFNINQHSKNDTNQGAEKLAEYIKSSKIVEDLKEHINNIRYKYLVKS